MKICITDATFKHSHALARYLHAYNPKLEIVGIIPYKPRFPKIFAKHFSRLVFGTLQDILQKEKPDLIIPVGNKSVAFISEMKSHNAILPAQQSVDLAMDKIKTLSLADSLGIPIPKTVQLKKMSDLENLDTPFPCVVKGVLEAGKNMIAYPKNKNELMTAVRSIQNDPSQNHHLPIIQEYVPGVGLGFFGFYQNGRLKRFYMHQRIREFPITGGASTAAKSIYHHEGFGYGKRLLDHLQWNGPAMVEFKFNPATGRLALMEINPKFWGSTELGLAAGINFGELLVRSIKCEDIEENLSEDSYKKIKFLWPCEGDWAAIIQGRNWLGFCDYIKGGYRTNLFSNGFLLNMLRLATSLKNLKKSGVP